MAGVKQCHGRTPALSASSCEWQLLSEQKFVALNYTNRNQSWHLLVLLRKQLHIPHPPPSHCPSGQEGKEPADVLVAVWWPGDSQ